MTWLKRENVLRGVSKSNMAIDIFCRHACYISIVKRKSLFRWSIIIENIHSFSFSDLFFPLLFFFFLYSYAYIYVNHRYGTVYDSHQWMLCIIIIIIVFYSVFSNKFFLIQWLNQIREVKLFISLLNENEFYWFRS